MLAAGHGEFLADDNLGNWNLSITEENRLELDLFDVLSMFIFCDSKLFSLRLLFPRR